MASIKIVASDLFVKSAHFFGGFSLPFAFFLGFKDCNATKRMICFHKLKGQKKKGGRKKTWGKK